MIREATRYIFILLCLFLVFYFIYPTRYEYIKRYDPISIIKVDRFTGESWRWRSADGWKASTFNSKIDDATE